PDLPECLGMFPLTLRQEVDAHIADRLLEAVWRESLWLVHDGIATTEQIDAAIRMGFGLRWAQMGLFETYRIAGGEAGMAHFLAQFGPALAWPWTKLTDVPDLSDAFVAKIAAQSDAQSGHMSIRELERKRDENLVGLLRALKQSKAGAGQVLLDHEARLPAVGPSDAPWVTLSVQVPSSWTDYNGHMNESHYLEAGSKATDCVLDRIGAGPDYVAGGFSYFTVESHVQHLAEIHAGDRLTAESQILAAEGKRLHLFHTLRNGTGAAVATHETLLVHVDLTSRRACVPLASVAARVATLAQDHMARPRPAGAGRAVGQRP
ncbi:MAG: thioesterase family protein, partial [Pseudomonadota bacterium]